MDPRTLQGREPELRAFEQPIDSNAVHHEAEAPSHSRRANDSAPLGAIFSPGRSGSTWLGAMVSSHPAVEYRFEPILRLRQTDAEVAELDEHLLNGGETDRAELHRVFCRPNPLIVKPPFVATRTWSPLPALTGAAWTAAKTGLPLSESLFGRCVAAGENAPIVFKEVERLHLVRAVAGMPEVPVVYMLRHPASVIASRLRGIESGLMPPITPESISERLERRPDIARSLPSVDALTTIQLEALAWRMNTDAALLTLKRHPDVRVVFYEALTRDPESQVQGVLEHLGFAPHPTTDKFIALSRSGASPWRRLWHGEMPVNGYFSVFRSSTISPWETAVDAADLDQIEALVGDGTAMSLANEAGEWLRTSTV